MLQAMLNKVLALDPELYRYLDQLEGKHFAIICKDFSAHSFYGVFSNKQILLSSSAPEQIDITIAGELRDFVKYALTKERGCLQISGDGLLASNMEKLYLEMDIDWEEELSKLTGDAIAYKTINLFRQLRSYTVESSITLGEMLTEYLQEEADVLPTAAEVDAFMQDVDDLRLRVDRLEARIKAYESN